MPRAHLGTQVPGVPLSVTAVAAKLGVSASTLRTWERRYGLGPGARPAGSHRRYLPEDVQRLSRMTDLIRSGVSAADAAATVLALGDDVLTEPVGDLEEPKDPADLLAAARNLAYDKLKRMLEVAISTDGLVHTWTTLIEPAIESVLASAEGESPGHAPSSMLAVATLAVLRAIADQCPHPDAPACPRGVVVLTDQDHILAAHVVGVALEWNGLRTSVISTGRHGGTTGIERFREHRARHDASVAVVMGRGATCEHLIGAVVADEDVDVLVLGADTPTVLDRHVVRVRTMTACVDEVIALCRAEGEEPAGFTR